MRKKMLSIILILAMLISTLPMTTLTAVAAETKSASVVVESVNATPGETVDVHISIEGNPGVLGATLTLTFDSRLTLTSAKNGDAFAPLAMTKPGSFSSPCKFVWDGQEIAEEDIADGDILILTFAVDEALEAGTELPITISCKQGDFVDENLNPITVNITSGSIAVINYIPGDLNGDKEVNISDVILLRRHIAGGYEQTINELAADVNADGDTTSSDIILMRRYIAGGYGVELKPGKTAGQEHTHTLTAKAATAATCTVDGNIAYWHCSECGKYFSDADAANEISQSDIIIKASHSFINGICTECGERQSDCYTISYDVSNGDSYLAKKVISNPNPNSFTASDSFTLKNLSVPGYRFLGWYDGAGDNADQVKKITVGTSEDLEFYAHWEKISYTVSLKSDIFIDSNTLSYTVDTGAVLPTPKLSNYVFCGWSDESGKLYSNTVIPSGTIGNITLTANWTSERNKTWTKSNLDDPIVIEDEDTSTILFVYEIGEIQNVPLYTIKDFGYIGGEGITKTESATYSTTISESMMTAYAQTVSNATTESSNWSLSSDWNDTTSLNEETINESGKTVGEVEAISKNDSSNWNISSGSSGSKDKTHLETDQRGWENEVKISKNSESSTTSGGSDTKTSKTSSHLDTTLEMSAPGLGKVGLEAGIASESGSEKTTEWSSTDKDSKGFEAGGSTDWEGTTTDTTVTSSSWNSSSSYGGSSSISESSSVAKAVSESVTNKYGYGSSYSIGGESTNAGGLVSVQSESNEYSSSVTYCAATEKSVTSEWTTQATKPGYHRWIVAGTAHVFAVVGYDMAEKAYFVYTYSVMDDETHEFEDYSYTTSKYNDNENGVISFEIPYEVKDYVAERTCYSQGLKINQSTGVITGYSGTDTAVVIPEYYNVGGGDVVKVSGISENAFKGNTNIEAVKLSKFITSIPDGAFSGCSALKLVYGGSINTIGANAFSGCSAMKSCAVSAEIESLGARAFDGIEKLYVKAANVSVAKNAANSGAKQIYMFVNSNKDGTSGINGASITVPAGTEYFELNGYKLNYTDFSLISDADETVINKVRFVNSGEIPMQISSESVILNNCSATASGFAAVLFGKNINLGLQGTVTLSSQNTNTLLCKNLALYESNGNVDGLLDVDGTVLIAGAITNEGLIRYDNLTTIDDDTFDRLLHAYTLIFDANGGNCSTDSKDIANGSTIGELPTPTRQYYTFDGWYTEKTGGSKVTSETVFSDGINRTVYAHWSPCQYTASWSTGTGYTITVKRTSSPNAGAGTGTLSSGAKVYYGDVLSITYAASTGYTLGTYGSKSITVSGNVTSSDIYASATVNSYTYNVVYKSSNGTALGSTTVTGKYGSSQTVSAPAKSGYNTPGSQTAKFDSTTAKTITFTYSPSGVSASTLSGGVTNDGIVTYSVSASCVSRTSSSATIQISWTNTLAANSWYPYSQFFKATCNGVSNETTVTAWNTWNSGNYVNYAKSSTGTLTVTVSVGSTNATNVSVSLYYYDLNYYGNVYSDFTKSITVAIPAY